MLPLAQRLARQLQRLVHQFGRATIDGGMCVDLALSQTDLAAIVGGSRQRVNRALRQMHLEGIVRLGEQRLMVPDEERLADIANGRLLLGNELSSPAS
jgi:CRP-like cAMP-binding protein